MRRIVDHKKSFLIMLLLLLLFISIANAEPTVKIFVESGSYKNVIEVQPGTTIEEVKEIIEEEKFLLLLRRNSFEVINEGR